MNKPLIVKIFLANSHSSKASPNWLTVAPVRTISLWNPSRISKILLFHFKFSLFSFPFFWILIHFFKKDYTQAVFLHLSGPSQNPQSSLLFYTAFNCLICLSLILLITVKLNKSISKPYTNGMAFLTPKRLLSTW